MNEYPRFGDFADEENPLEGEKKKLDGYYPWGIRVSENVFAVVYNEPSDGYIKTIDITISLAAARHRFTGGLQKRAMH